MRDRLFEELKAVCGPFATDDPKSLEGYSATFSFVPPRRASYAVFPGTADEVQRIVQIANEHRVPVVPKSSGIDLQGGTVPAEGGIVVDLKRMNHILEIDERNKMVRIEPGVRYGELQHVLQAHGLMALNPLLAHPLKSVLTSYLERDPLLIPKFEYGDPILTMEVVLPTGRIFRTGSAAAPGAPDDTIADLVGPHGPGLDFQKIFQAAQGTFGIVTWMSIKAEPIPTRQKLYFIPFSELERAIDVVYRVERAMLGSECFLLNDVAAALIFSRGDKERIESMKRALPPWIAALIIAGGARRPEEKIEYEEEALFAISTELEVKPSRTLAGCADQGPWLETLLRQPWPSDLPYWRFAGKGGGRTISFHTTLDRFSATHGETLRRFQDRAGEMACYLQPIERGRVCAVEYGIRYNPADEEEVEQTAALERLLNESLYQQGALFTKPYGSQAAIAYGRNVAYTTTLTELKHIFDPNRIMNPGKLCF